MTSTNAALDRAHGEALPKVRPVVTFTRAGLVEFRPTDWLIEGWLVRNTLAGLIGPSGSGKSFLAIDWACRIATGTHWLGRKVKPGGVFYMAGEGQQGLRKRIAAWEGHFGQSMADAPLYVSSGLPFLCNDLAAFGTIDAIDALTDELLFDCGGVEPELIVVDTVARAMAGENENAADAMGRFVRAMDIIRERWGATVLAVHHTGHAEAGRARGSSALYAALDSEFLLKPSDKSIELSGTKQKDWSAPNGMVLQKVQVPVEIEGTDGRIIRDTSLVLKSDLSAVIDAEKRKRAYVLHREKQSTRQISEEIGVPKSTVARWLKEFEG